MGRAQLRAVVRHMRHLAGDSTLGEESDDILLRAFLSRNDQAAFETLILRHGPMVLQICRRLLGNAHDAEDAFQATFLILARKAASIRKKESLASWLHRVAYRMATDARKSAARRHKHESGVRPAQPGDPALVAAWQELQALLDQEIERLPATLRTPFILCCVQDRTCAEAARELGLEEGTIWNRLGRARKLLQKRLTRRGVTLPAGFLVGLLGKNKAAAVPAPLVASTGKAAVQMGAGCALVPGLVSAQVMTLVEGVLRTMFLSKLKMAILLSCLTILGAGFGLTGSRRASAEPPKGPPAAEKATAGGREAGEDVVRVSGHARIPAPFVDGTSNTIVFAERYSASGGRQYIPGACNSSLLQSPFAGGEPVGTADGSVRRVSSGVSQYSWSFVLYSAEGMVFDSSR